MHPVRLGADPNIVEKCLAKSSLFIYLFSQKSIQSKFNFFNEELHLFPSIISTAPNPKTVYLSNCANRESRLKGGVTIVGAIR